MRYWVFPAFLLACLLLLPSIGLAWPGKFVEVTDGDTLVVMKGKKEVDVRLYGIDKPESDQPFGIKVTRFAASLVGNERVEIDQKDRDQYGRVVGLVYIEGDGECLNEELVRAGHAGSTSAIAISMTAITGKFLSNRPGRQKKGSGRNLILSRPGIGDAVSVAVLCPEVSVQAERTRTVATSTRSPRPRGSLRSTSPGIRTGWTGMRTGRRVRGLP